VVFVLSVLEGADRGLSITLDASSPTRLLVGTSPVCGVPLSDPEVSRRHVALTLVDDYVQLIDLGSTNGTSVNGILVKEVLLAGGEVIRVGRSVLTVKRGAPQPAPIRDGAGFGRIVGESSAMCRIYPLFERLAESERPLLIEGEAGTGKELLAEEIHRASARANGPFAVLETSNVAAHEIPNRLFGSGDDPGLIERAWGGVLFIDEVGDLPRHVQTRLRAFVAASRDLRLIAATKRDLDRDVTKGRFDEAFFFELASGRVELPPLRDRMGDVEILARHFWAEIVPVQDGPAPEFPVDLLPRFEHYRWPGNVRELRSAVRQRATMGELARTYLSDLPDEASDDLVAAVIRQGLSFPDARDRVLLDLQRRYVEAALARHGGNVGEAARASGIAVRYFQLVRAKFR
jgi:DNA-binding NtrC family response regulator